MAEAWDRITNVCGLMHKLCCEIVSPFILVFFGCARGQTVHGLFIFRSFFLSKFLVFADDDFLLIVDFSFVCACAYLIERLYVLLLWCCLGYYRWSCCSHYSCYSLPGFSSHVCGHIRSRERHHSTAVQWYSSLSCPNASGQRIYSISSDPQSIKTTLGGIFSTRLVLHKWDWYEFGFTLVSRMPTGGYLFTPESEPVKHVSTVQRYFCFACSPTRLNCLFIFSYFWSRHRKQSHVWGGFGGTSCCHPCAITSVIDWNKFL